MATVGLGQLLVNSTSSAAQQYKQNVFVVWNNSTGTQNGGSCCCWSVPSGVGASWVTFELFGGGGDGPGGCCCMSAYNGPGGGAYSKKTLQTVPGCYFIICAGGSGCCQVNCCGTCGFPSFVVCGANSTTAACATGGNGGCGLCWHGGFNNCTGVCVAMFTSGCSSSLGDFIVPSMQSTQKDSNYCTQYVYTWQAGTPKLSNNSCHTFDTCTIGMAHSGCMMVGSYTPVVPCAGPGSPGIAGEGCGGGCCWGSWGQGGMVVVTWG
jgi:hypothetical protein